jgi:hypothetical protein
MLMLFEHVKDVVILKKQRRVKLLRELLRDFLRELQHQASRQEVTGSRPKDRRLPRMLLLIQ